MGGWFSKQPQLSTADEHRLSRKCKSLSHAYARCHKANPNDAQACNNLQTSLVMCYAQGEGGGLLLGFHLCVVVGCVGSVSGVGLGGCGAVCIVAFVGCVSVAGERVPMLPVWIPWAETELFESSMLSFMRVSTYHAYERQHAALDELCF